MPSSGGVLSGHSRTHFRLLSFWISASCLYSSCGLQLVVPLRSKQTDPFGSAAIDPHVTSTGGSSLWVRKKKRKKKKRAAAAAENKSQRTAPEKKNSLHPLHILINHTVGRLRAEVTSHLYKKRLKSFRSSQVRVTDRWTFPAETWQPVALSLKDSSAETALESVRFLLCVCFLFFYPQPVSLCSFFLFFISSSFPSFHSLPFSLAPL